MHFVVNNQSPVALHKNRKVGKLFAGAAAPRQNLVGGNSDFPDFLCFSGIFADLIGRKRCFVKKLLFPLTDGRYIGRQNQRGALQFIQNADTDDGLSRAARQYDDAVSGSRRLRPVKRFDRVGLIVADAERLSGSGCRRPQRQFQRFAVNERRFVLRRIADIDQRLLQKPAVQQRNEEFSVFFRYQPGNRFLGEDFAAYPSVVDLDFDFSFSAVGQYDFSEF